MTQAIAINGQFIEIDETIKIDFGFEVKASLILFNKLILVLDPNNYSPINENVVCLNSNGDKIWTIEYGEWPENRDCPVTGIWWRNNKLFVYRRCGIEQEIDVNNGKELNSELIK